jgi:cellulose synthase/poly-beta-1,6-N-acetylglucosamine synthase-like glycosyltransferase
MDLLDSLLLVSSLTVTVVFFAYGFNIFYMLRLSRKYTRPILNLGRKPTIALHLPIFNERYVAERLLEACSVTAELYGKDKIHVSVLDDSDDETTSILQGVAEGYRARGFNFDVQHRDDRSGYKAGALNAALERAKEEFIVVFDSDFLPRPDFLDRAASYITSDDSLGVVQFRWSYTNREYNWITKAVSMGMDAHFMIEQPGRCAGGLFLNFNGSAGIIRTKALRESGGWQSDTLAEDLDASYRMQMHGHRIQYVKDDVPCEIPPTVAGFKRQQGRWARGSLQVAKKSLPTLLKEKEVTRRQKFEAFIHLTYYFVHPLMYISFLLAATAAIFNVGSIRVVIPTPSQIAPIIEVNPAALSWTSLSWTSLFWGVFIFCILLCTAAAWIYYVVAVRMQRIGVLRNWRYLIVLGLLGYGISVSNTIEAAKAFLLKGSGVFRRTPKYAVVGRDGTWKDKRYQVPLDYTSIAEALSVLLAAAAIGRAVVFSNFGIILILGVYAFAFVFVFSTTISQSGKENATPALGLR